MSANFLDTSGFGMGADFHMFIAGPLIPVPVPVIVHVVFDAHAFVTRSWREAKTVTTGHFPVLQSNWAMIVVPHVCIPPGPMHPALEPLMLFAIVAASSSQPQLTVHSVSAQQGALLTAGWDAFGVNLDCSDAPMAGGMFDVNLNSVMTSPTLGDYVAAVFNALWTLLFSWGLGWAFGKVGAHSGVASALKDALTKYTKDVLLALLSIPVAMLQHLLDYLRDAGGPVAQFFSKLASQFQRLIDGDPALGPNPFDPRQ